MLLILAVLKIFFFSETPNELISKKLFDYFTEEKNDKDNYNRGAYNTFASSKDSKSEKKLKSDSEKNLLISNVDNDNRTLENLIQTETSKYYINIYQDDKNMKFMRFAVDYCRSSPNLELKNKTNILFIGWRNSKYNFHIEFEDKSNIKGEKIMVNLY